MYTSIWAAILSAALAPAATAQSADRPMPSAPGTICTYNAVAYSTALPYTRTFTTLDAGNAAGVRCIQIVNGNNPTPSRVCVNADGNPVEFNNTVRSPHSGFYSWPLVVGKEWQHSYIETPLAGGASSHHIKHLRVIAYERVIAGGNSYDAFRIESRNQNQQGGRTSTETTWYAPSMGRSVKYEGSNVDKMELLSCNR
jgi:hypothetical protein